MAFSVLRETSGRFARSEDGSILVFALVMFVLMVMMGGMAVDIMRYEDTRVTLQQTLDRSTLAAASMTQTLTPQDVVADYMAKAGLGDQLDNVVVTQSATQRSVLARGKVDLNPYFMHMMGIHNLPARAAAQAEQGVDNLEISLVLDVSGSMSGQKIIDLRAAAAEFATTMLQNDPFGRVSISIVPYNAQVNLGADLRGKFQAVNVHGVANIDCLELPDAAYGTPAVPRDLNLPMMAYVDLGGGTSRVDAAVSPTSTSYALPNYNSTSCRPNQANIVRLPSQDLNTIVAQINALTAGGNTSITLGMKWGMTLLDPVMTSAFQEFSTAGLMSANLADRPFAYADPQAQKVIILMTDGEHVAHNRINDAYKTGPSQIWLAPDGNYSVYKTAIAGPDKFYVPHLDTFQATAYAGGGAATEQTWQQIWSKLKVSYVAWQFSARALASGSTAQNAVYTAEMGAMVSQWKSATQMDALLQTTCGQARVNETAFRVVPLP